MSSENRRTGPPRAMLKTQKCREIAQSIMQRERREVQEKQNDSPYERHESTAQSSQALAKRMVRPSCLDASSEKDLKKLTDETGNQKEAVTYWSHELVSCNKPHFPVTPLNRGSPLFARCASFSNDIDDSRVRHKATANENG
ncbi:hypothetical protein ACHAXR_003300 [Thalassiosira sp. AJA248-18]